MNIATPTYSDPIYQGDITAFKLSLSNSNAAFTVNGVNFTNTLPTQLNGVRLVSYTCKDGEGATFTPTGTVNVSSGQVVLTNGTLPKAQPSGASGACEIVFEVTSSTVADGQTVSAWSNVLPAGGVRGTENGIAISNGDAASQSVTVRKLASPTLTKSFSKPTIVKADEVTTLTLVIANGSSDRNLPLNTASHTPPFALRDTFPAGLVVAPTPNTSVVCTGTGAVAPSFSAASGDTVIRAIGGTVAPGGACTIKVDVIGTTTNNEASASYTNRVNNNPADPDFGNQRGLTANAASATLAVKSGLNVSKAFKTGVISANQASELVITLKNENQVNAIDFTEFVDSPIDGVGNAGHGLTITGTPTLNGCGASTVSVIDGGKGIRLGSGSIARNASCVITVPFTGTLESTGEGKSYTNTIAKAAVKTVDTTIISNMAQHSVTVVDQLTVEKKINVTEVAPGSPASYTITVKNYASAPLTNIQINDPLPTGVLALASSPAAPSVAGSCSALSHNIDTTPSAPTFTVANMSAGTGVAPSVCEVTFWVMMPKNAAINNDIKNVIPKGAVTAHNGTGTIGNNYGSDHNSADNPNANANAANTKIVPGLFPTKVFNPQTGPEGSVSVLTITLSNRSSNKLTNTTFTDNLPLAGGAQLVIANPASASTTCEAGTVTAIPGSNSVTLSGATIPARGGVNGSGSFGTCTVQVKVTGPAGTYSNVIALGQASGTQTNADGTTEVITNKTTATASLSLNSALGATKSFFPETISAGGTSTATITVLNTASSGVLNNVSVLDPLPAGMTIATPSNARTTCNGAPVITAEPGTNSAGIAGLVLPANSQCAFVFDVKASGSGSWTNTIPPGNIQADGGVRNINAVSATLTNNASASVIATINANPSVIAAPGAVSLMEIKLENSGAIALTGLGLQNFFTDNGLAGGKLTGMKIASNPNMTTTCTGGIVTPGSDGNSVSLSDATLAPGQTCVVSFNVTTIVAGTLPNSLVAGAITNHQGISTTAGSNTSLSVSGNIGVNKEFIPAVVKPNERSKLRLTFFNPREFNLTDLTAVDNLPSGLKIPASPNAFTTCTGAVITTPTERQLRVTGGTLPPGGPGVTSTCYVEIDVLSDGTGAYKNTILPGEVTSSQGNNPTETTSTLQVRDPAVITKTFNPVSVSPGKPSTVTITISNPNTIPLTKALLSDILPQNVFVAPTPNASTTCTSGVVTATPSAGNVVLTGGTIPAGGSCIVKFDVISNIAGIYVNTIPAAGLQTLEGITNDKPADATLNLLDPPTVNKQFDPIAIPANGTSVLSIVLGNTNKTEATLTAALIDTLPTSPGRIVVAPVPAIGGTCDISRVTAVAGSGTVTYANGAKIPAGGCTITVNVTGSVEGSYNNFIASGELKTNFGNNVQPASANLEISPLGAISGKVFKDNNVVPNGTYELGVDTPLANQTMRLTGTATDEFGGTVNVNVTTTTDALGNYSFIGLLPGTYTVTQIAQPAGTSNGITTAGTILGGGTPGTATTVATPVSVISTIVLNKDGNGKVATTAGNNFAEIVLSSISGNVFLDQNNDGVRNPADSGLKDVVIELLDDQDRVIRTVKTDENGHYEFKDLPPGTYSVRQPTQPENTINGKTTAGTVGNGGTPGTPSAQNVTPSIISKIVLPPATSTTENNFAELPTGRQISGHVFADYNNDGIFDQTDVALANVEIVLSGVDINGAPVSRTTTTDANGKYVFIGLPEGIYTVTEPEQPPRTVNGITTAGSTGGTATAVTVTPSAIKDIDLTGNNAISSENNFAEAPILTGTVNGKVYLDKNNDGIVDAGESGIPAVTVILTGTDKNGQPVNVTVVTDASGNYSFKDVPPSDTHGYTITEVQPPSYTDGKTTVASGNPGTPRSDNVNTNDHDVITGVVVEPGDVLNGYNYGEQGDTLQLKPPIVNGYVYMDRDHSRIRRTDGTTDGVRDWTVVLSQNGTKICEVKTDEHGFYQFDNLHCPGYEVSGLPIGTGFEINFTKDGQTRPIQPQSKEGDVDGMTASIKNIELKAEDRVIEQNLPLDPSGVVYDALTRQPVNGAIVKLVGPAGFDPTTHLTTSSDTQVVGSDGYYEFWLQGTYPTGTYTLAVTSPPGYLQGQSGYLPACNGPLNVGATPNPGLVQESNTAPALSVPQALDPAACVGMVPGGAQTTQYYYSFVITNGVSAEILNNHIPLDPVQQGAIIMTKTSPMVNVSRGDLVPYTITATNTLSATLPAVVVRDQIPPGFKYRSGSASVNGVAIEPVVSGRLLTWPNQNFTASEKKVIRLILTVGAGVGDGEYVNQTWSNSAIGNFILSNIATATVRVVPDPTFDCPDIIGTVFDDQNGNGYQDDGEPGIPSVRVVTARGLLVTTDAQGRFHVPCPAIPNADRGSNFVMKLDTRTLPSGYRVTTENPRDVRITRGKVVKLNFGATIHRVVRLELSDAAFEAGKEVLLPQWQAQLDQLPEQLRERPSVVRLGYTPGNDAPALVAKRKKAIHAAIKQRWNALNGKYTLNIETEDAQ